LMRWTGSGAGTFQRIYPEFAPLEEAALEDIDLSIFHRTMPRWNAVYSKELEPLARASATGGGAALDTRVFTPRQRARLAFYAEVFDPDGVREAIYGSVAIAGKELSTISLCNRSRIRPFGDEDVAILRSLLPVISVSEGLLEKLEHRVETDVPIAGLTRRECA